MTESEQSLHTAVHLTHMIRLRPTPDEQRSTSHDPRTTTHDPRTTHLASGAQACY